MAHVLLDANGKVSGAFVNPQPQIGGYAEIADDDPRVIEFRGRSAARVARKQSHLAVRDVANLAQLIQIAQPADIDAFVGNAGVNELRSIVVSLLKYLSSQSNARP
jgi:hypothetical protein